MNNIIKIKNKSLYEIAFIAMVMLMNTKSMAQEISYNNPTMLNIASANSKDGWINFKSEIELNPLTVFSENKSAFGLGANDEMRLVKSDTDNIGFIHYRYQQYHQGYKIQGAEYIVHQNENGKVYCANGKMVAGLNKTVFAKSDETVAMQQAMEATGAKGFKWQNAANEKAMQLRRKNNAATYFPKGELVWSMPGDAEKFDASQLRLCWKFDINTDSTAISKRMFVDAETGAIVKQLPLELFCNATTGVTTFNGTKTIYTKFDNPEYILENDCPNNANIHVFNANTSQTLNYATDYTTYSGSNYWQYQNAAVQTFWGLREAYRYFKSKHNRIGYDGADSDMEGYNNAIFPNGNGGLTGNNASWNSGEEVWRFGTGMSNQTNQDDVNTLDIIGHEYAHAITQFTAGLEYQKESGALNESFSDIFGECLEFYSTLSIDYLHGGDRGANRIMSNPDSLGHPDTYYGSNFLPTNCNPIDTNDYCGVHTNSSVQNFAFYLIANGDTGTNDNGVRYEVEGIGVYKTSQIAYKALFAYLTSTSNFADAREAWIHAAIDLYGSCSNEVIQVAKAWHAVGVGTTLPVYNNNVCGNYPPGNANYEIQGVNSVVGSGSGCANTITASAYTVYYSGGFAVDMMPGFDAEPGSNFIARIYECAVTNYRVGEDEASEVTEQNALIKSATDQFNENSFSASPNPFNNYLKINFNLNKAGAVSFKLFDMLGKEIMEINRSAFFAEGNNAVELQTENLPAGVYMLRVEMEGAALNQKVIKQ